MKSLQFRSIIKIIGVNPYVHVTKEQLEQIKADWKKPLPVLVQINGKPDEPWHINMMPMGDGDFYLYLHGEVRKAANAQVGDEVMVDVRFDSDYQNGPQHSMSDGFQSALHNNLVANKNWEALPPSRKKEILRYFAQLKSPEAIERNITRALEVLSGTTGRFMARTWKDGV